MLARAPFGSLCGILTVILGMCFFSDSLLHLPCYFHQRSHAKSATAGVEPGFARFQEGGTGDIEMDPGLAGDEFFQELCGGDGAAPAAVADVLDVGHFTANLLAEL